MYQMMKRGWSREELLQFLEVIHKGQSKGTLWVDIFRGDKVSQLFGEVEDKGFRDSEVIFAFERGEVHRSKHNGFLHVTYPIRARKECLSCHINANEGDVLGVIEIVNNYSQPLSQMRRKLLLFFFLLLPIPLLGSLLGGRHLSRKLRGAIEGIQREVTQLNSIDDLRKIRVRDQRLGFRELSALFREINALANKMKSIVDFEINLLEKLIISSESVRDWKAFAHDMLAELDRVVPIYCIFPIFQNGNRLSIDFFWRGSPDQSIVKDIEDYVKKEVSKASWFNKEGIIETNHSHISHDGLPGKKVIKECMRIYLHQTSIVGGIVGVGISSPKVKEPTVSQLIMGFLPNLSNVMGAVKAIDGYVRDIEYFATRDSLTELFNQRLFWELLQYEIKRAERHRYTFSLLLIDIDNFKLINDTYGHAFGDKFLKVIAKVLKETIRGEDILARYGGDEFSIILPRTEKNASTKIAERIRKRIKEMNLKAPNGDIAKATISIGVAVYPHHATNAKDLFKIADDMLYKAKEEGKDRIESPEEKSTKRKTNLVHLLRAIREEESLTPFFQPIVDIERKVPIGVEVLMRLGEEHVPAGDFIEAAERLGVVSKLDRVIYKKTFIKVKEENYRGLIFLNLCPCVGELEPFIQEVLELLQKYDVSPHQVVFELIERKAIREIREAARVVKEVKSIGFRFAVDDFGTGYSSFHYLKRLPVDFLKIDGQFIKGLLKDSMDRAFVKSVISFSKEIGIKTVAEAVENEETLKMVKELGVDYVQGFLFGKPTPELPPSNRDRDLLSLRKSKLTHLG
jgi:diguanylate cyclase (GGDEF)-like protein